MIVTGFNEHNLGAAVFLRLILSARQTAGHRHAYYNFPAFPFLEIPQIRPMKWTLI